MEWDDRVDILCTGSGVAGLATAIAAVDAGADVFVADSVGIDVGDDATNRYFGELSRDLRAPVRPAATVDTPMRVVDDLAPATPTSRRVEPFVGSRLRDWAAGCLASPFGFVYSRVSERRAVTMRSSRGESFEVAAIGLIDVGPDLPKVILSDWLSDQARDRGIDVWKDSPLQRIVFCDGRVLGAVLDTPSGPRAVRARHGVLVSIGGPDPCTACDVGETSTLQVSLVRQAPSRFGRVELLTTEPLLGTPSETCRPMSRRLIDAARETRQGRSPHWRCGELHRYPPLGQ
jgi:FAD binding domain